MITVQTVIQADRATVWACYTAPEHIINWNAASDDWCCPSASNELRVGGRYSARMESRDQTMGFDFEAVYDEVMPIERLVYTIADGRKVSILFSTRDEQTTVTIHFEAETVHPEALQQQGWQSILDRFKHYVERVAT